MKELVVQGLRAREFLGTGSAALKVQSAMEQSFAKKTKCIRGSVGLLEVAAFFFLLLDRVQIKMLESPRQLFVSTFWLSGSAR